MSHHPACPAHRSRRFGIDAAFLAATLALGSCKDSDGGAERDPVTTMGTQNPDSLDSGIETRPSAPDGGGATTPSAVAEECWFEDLGNWIRCEGTGYPNVVDVGAMSAQECADACLDDEGCTAILDYHWRGWGELGCLLHIATCDSPEFDEFAEGDGAKMFRKACGETPPANAITHFEETGGIVVAPGSGCVFQGLIPPLVCDTHRDPDLEIVGAETLDECLAMCQERPDCTAVKDKPQGDYDGLECLLHLSTCDEVLDDQPETSDDLAYVYRKVCEDGFVPDAGN